MSAALEKAAKPRWTRPNILAAALYYARLGYSFYPTRPRSKAPFDELLPIGLNKQGKRGPVWSVYRERQPAPEEICTWYEIAPDANLALITGHISNLVIIEFDDTAGADVFCDMCGAASISSFTPRSSSRGAAAISISRIPASRSGEASATFAK